MSAILVLDVVVCGSFIVKNVPSCVSLFPLHPHNPILPLCVCLSLLKEVGNLGEHCRSIPTVLTPLLISPPPLILASPHHSKLSASPHSGNLNTVPILWLAAEDWWGQGSHCCLSAWSSLKLLDYCQAWNSHTHIPPAVRKLSAGSYTCQQLWCAELLLYHPSLI